MDERETRSEPKPLVLGVIVGNRGFFPDELCRTGREEILRVLEQEGIEAVALSPEETKLGTVESLEDAAKCARRFAAERERIDGILVTLPNFGDERGVANAIRWSGLDVPVLVHAFADDPGGMGLEARRDSFCGKISVCNNLRQYGIKFSLTSRHTVSPGAQGFRHDLRWFAGVCRVTRSLKRVRFGAVGTRPPAFNTVRYSEKILEAHGISIEPIDLSEILGRIKRLADGDGAVRDRLEALRSYTDTSRVPEEALLRMARLAAVLDEWITAQSLAGIALQCWTALQEHLGIVPCAVMSLLGNSLIPSACEVDVPGLVGMYALQQASGGPAAILDWNNNYGDDSERCVLFHCSNVPKQMLSRDLMDYQAIISGTVGKENAFGALVGRIKPGPFTFARVSTDDATGLLKAYCGEGEFTEEPMQTFGGFGVARIPDLPGLLRHICERGFEHHVAVAHTQTSSVLREALGTYLGWDVYHHNAL